ncbi:hypothetical protein EDB92DRAFT_1941727 [Lactarius akahatsu]|uniref:Uncharacterized protein n=1 Tax=Lactarius akahatsu TaxID=416441 RepID=A0AAD4LM56_9AGAM|nr:hypothetical protein EDB92DRAFT_1941727 [Lactarius akahatsu]
MAVHKTLLEISTYLNDVLSKLFPGSSLSAARWTKNNNLPPTPLPLSPLLLEITVRWSRLLINNIPTRASPSCGAYSPSKCQDTLACNNPAYEALKLTRLPYWVKHPDSYAPGSSSSLVVSFEDLTGGIL